MKKGYSVVVTATDAGRSRYYFISKKWLKIIISIFILVVVVVVVGVVSYSSVYYRALETAILKQRNTEIEKEFAKLQEIKRNLEIAEVNNRKIRVMLGIAKTPDAVEPVINEVADYSENIDIMTKNEENIPSLLPTIGHISRSFGPAHQGLDIAAARFSPVIAAASGVITAAGWDSIFGNYVIIEHNINYSTFYGHLYSIGVKKNDQVSSGQVIGTVGSTGRSTSPHLHYEVRFKNKPVDPVAYLPALFLKL
jgi:murein DD-endopeptidase MepM/ murein hydrolase activator NlpD